MKPTEFEFEREETPAAGPLAMPNVPDLPDGDPADFEHWQKVARWTIEEATALSFGIEPRWVAWANVKEWHYPFGIDYKKRLTLGLRAQQAGDLQEPSEPIAFIAWAKSVGISFPAELERMVHMVVKPAKPLGMTEKKKIRPPQLCSFANCIS